MKISEDQIRRSVDYLRTAPREPASRAHPLPAVSDEFLERVRTALAAVPDVRPDRVEAARELMAGNLPDSTKLAEKLIGRVLSDRLR
jgi:hypothetical protein